MNPVAQQLIEAGLIQFGWFEQGDLTAPVAVHMEMLASFPDVLALIVAESRAALDLSRFSRILATADAVPLATAISLSSGVPLVYSRGTTEPPASDFVGAYDGGHATLLIANAATNAVAPDQDLAPLIARARRVGLLVDSLLTVLELRPPALDDIPVTALLRLHDLVRDLATDHRLPTHHAQSVLEWISAV